MAGLLTLGCDLGERGTEHPVDVALLDLIDVASIACGGHAGDAESVRFYRSLAERKRVKLCAHLSYPDRAGFGRSHGAISIGDLLDALEEQKRLLDDVPLVKLHGALYNDSCSSPELAASLAEWMRSRDTKAVLTMPGSALAASCAEAGISVVAEAFVERRYRLEGGRLLLVDRARDGAVIGDLASALEQARSIAEDARVLDGAGVWRPLRAETLCIHSDSPIALELARGVRKLLAGLGPS